MPYVLTDAEYAAFQQMLRERGGTGSISGRGVTSIPGMGTVVGRGTQPPERRPRRGKTGAQMCLVQQNGSDPNGDPMYDIFDLNDTGFLNKLNVDPIVPENYRDPDITYTAGESGEFQTNDVGIFFLFVYNEVPDIEDCAT